MIRRIFFIVLICCPLFLAAQYSKDDAYNYIDEYKSVAVELMQTTKIPASIKLAQAIYVSNAGKRTIAIDGRNHFGLLCNKEYTGDTYVDINDPSETCYRKYTTVRESYEDHAAFIIERSRYNKLFFLDITDYKGWANGLQEAGYSANPQYAQKLIDIIETYYLMVYDQPRYNQTLQTEPIKTVTSLVEKKEEPQKKEPIDEKLLKEVPTVLIKQDPQPELKAEEKEEPRQVVIQTEPQQVAKQEEKTEKKETPVIIEPVRNNADFKRDTISGIEIIVERKKKPEPKKETEIKEDTKPLAKVETKTVVTPVEKKTVNQIFTAREYDYRNIQYPYSYRKVFLNNNVRFIIAKKNDTYARIAKEMTISEADLRLYNDVYDDKIQPIENEVIYIQKKATKSPVEHHLIMEGESMRYIAQKYAIQLKTLLKKNNFLESEFTVGNIVCISCKK